MRTFESQIYDVRSAAEAMREDKWSYRPAAGSFKDEKPAGGPAEVRTFAEQVKHVACSNFAFAAELDGTKPPEACDKGGPSTARTRAELLMYLRDSFATLKKSLKQNGALWVIRPKGRPEISERAVMDAGKSAGLVDVKVISFSPTHTGEKFVIPVANRR